jgi:hypothetical protein
MKLFFISLIIIFILLISNKEGFRLNLLLNAPKKKDTKLKIATIDTDTGFTKYYGNNVNMSKFTQLSLEEEGTVKNIRNIYNVSQLCGKYIDTPYVFTPKPTLNLQKIQSITIKLQLSARGADGWRPGAPNRDQKYLAQHTSDTPWYFRYYIPILTFYNKNKRVCTIELYRYGVYDETVVGRDGGGQVGTMYRSEKFTIGIYFERENRVYRPHLTLSTIATGNGKLMMKADKTMQLNTFLRAKNQQQWLVGADQPMTITLAATPPPKDAANPSWRPGISVKPNTNTYPLQTDKSSLAAWKNSWNNGDTIDNISVGMDGMSSWVNGLDATADGIIKEISITRKGDRAGGRGGSIITLPTNDNGYDTSIPGHCYNLLPPPRTYARNPPKQNTPKIPHSKINLNRDFKIDVVVTYSINSNPGYILYSNLFKLMTYGNVLYTYIGKKGIQNPISNNKKTTITFLKKDGKGTLTINSKTHSITLDETQDRGGIYIGRSSNGKLPFKGTIHSIKISEL